MIDDLDWQSTKDRNLSLLDRCLSTNNLLLTSVAHTLLLKSGATSHTLISNRLLLLYSRLGSLPSALLLFDEIPNPNLSSLNTLLSSLTRHHSLPRAALSLFSRLQPPSLDRFTAVSLASACASLSALRPLRQLHASLILRSVPLTIIASNALVDAYGKCNEPDSSKCVFDRMPERDVVSWTSLVAAFARAGRLDEAHASFLAMPERNTVSWTALISGHEQNGEEERALVLFEEMMCEHVKPTPFTLVSVISACARLGLIDKGKQAHAHILRAPGLLNIFTCNALIDMYSKCGDTFSASMVFDSMPERDVVSWNSIITGFAQNGLGLQSFVLFDRMIRASVKPTHVTFLGVISACSHAGLVSEGQKLLSSMEVKYGIRPGSDHFAALIDALGRKRQLREAAELIKSLHLSNAGTWGALLGACQVHGELELGKWAAESLLALEPENGARYVALSNMYAAAGKWEEAKRVRSVMKRKGLTKDGGFSWIEVRSVKHVFGAGDESHCQAEEVYGMLCALVDQMMGERN